MPDNYSILPDEIELFTLMSKGDESAFTIIFRYYEPRIYPFIARMTGSELIAQDIVQEIFLTLWLRREFASDIENPRAYIFRMAANKTATWLKREARKSFIEKDAGSQMVSEHNDVSEKLMARELGEKLHLTIEHLPPQQKLVYRLNREGGYKNEEIAQQLNLSEKTVRNHLTKALKSIRKDLKNYPEISLAVFILVMKLHS